MHTGNSVSADVSVAAIPKVVSVNEPEQTKGLSNRSIDSGAALRDRLAVLQPFLSAPGTTDVAVNKAGEVWTENDTGWHQTLVPDLTMPDVRRLAQLIATFNKQNINENKPSLSGMLPDGERVQVIVPPAVDPNTVSITIRKPSAVLKTRADYEKENLTADIVDAVNDISDTDKQLVRLRKEEKIWDFLELAVQARCNMVISGATGSGKTTLSKTLAAFIPPHERIVTIEDVREIELPNHPNIVNMLYSAGGAGTTKVEAKELLQACLRMKPSRILLAEVRSKVAYDYIVNVSSGHPGSITTVHAGSCNEAFEMLALRMLESPEGRGLSREATMALLRSKIDIIIQLNVIESLHADGSISKNRRITEIYHDPSNKSAWQ